jgi:Gas vesicle protein G
MGLITGLLTLPLAPVRGTMRVAGLLERQAQNELNDESDVRAGLAELETAREEGWYSEAEIQEAEDALLERLIALRGLGEQETDGQQW